MWERIKNAPNTPDTLIIMKHMFACYTMRELRWVMNMRTTLYPHSMLFTDDQICSKTMRKEVAYCNINILLCYGDFLHSELCLELCSDVVPWWSLLRQASSILFIGDLYSLDATQVLNLFWIPWQHKGTPTDPRLIVHHQDFPLKLWYCRLVHPCKWFHANKNSPENT